MTNQMQDFDGTVKDIMQIGMAGFKLRNVAGVGEFRNDVNNAYVVVRGAAPVGPYDFANRKYVDTIEPLLLVKRQADCTTVRPNNTAVEGYVAVTTAGDGAITRDILYDNGLNDAAKMEVLAAREGRCIATTVALTGGTIAFDPDSIYIDDASTPWLKIGDIGALTGPVRVERMDLANITKDSTFVIPANAKILSVSFEITTAYSAGATVDIGQAGDVDLVMANTENNPLNLNYKYCKNNLDIAWGASALVLKVTVGGTPALGAGVVYVTFTNPNV